MTNTTPTPFHSVNDRYDPDGGVYTLEEFLAMCRECFGEAPALTETQARLYDRGEWRKAYKNEAGEETLIEYREGDEA
jgi:hypothetical protein